MHKTLIRKLYCPIGDDCPALEHITHDDGRERVRVTGEDPADPTREIEVDADPSLFPGIVDLRIQSWPEYLRAHRKPHQSDLLRVQTLTRYGATSDDEDYQRYVAGEAEPASKFREAWFLQLEAERKQGQIRRNLHVIDTSRAGDLAKAQRATAWTSYLAYAFEWGYAYNVQHGQQIRILDLAEHPAGSFLRRLGDFWVVEGQHVAQCGYDEIGRPTGLTRVEAGGAQGYIAAAEMAWDLAQEFTVWWRRHPELHRKTAAAA